MTKLNNWNLCCISKTLSDNGTNFKTMTLTQFNKLPRKEALAELCNRILHNFKTTELTIRFCQLNNIAGYRLSSSLCPIITHESIQMKICDLPNFRDIQYITNRIKNLLSTQPIRISAHPSEYISLSTEDETILSNSFRDLEQHSEIFDLLDLPLSYHAPLNIHVRKDGDPEKISSIVMHNYERLPDNVRKRLVFENNDNQNGVWSIRNLFKYFYENHKIPVTFDCLHHSILPDGLNEQDAFDLAYSTWDDHTPIFHYSEGIEENGVLTRKHRDMPTTTPRDYNRDVLWDVELKSKDLAIFEIRRLKELELKNNI
jgi:UV DNA damage endonuclease